MSPNSFERPAIRSIHLQGGCRVNDVGEDELQFELAASNGQIPSLIVPNFFHAYGVLRKSGFVVLGTDFYFAVEQADGGRLPNWKSHHPVSRTRWPCAEQADHWSFIAHAAIKQKHEQLWDIASRVSHQLRTCDWRLRQVSECYRDQLHAKVRRGDFTEGQRFVDGFTWLGYLAIQAFLVDACVLRDYMAEYRALLLTQSGERCFKSKVTSIGSLKKHYLDKFESAMAVDQAIAKATDVGGWLQLIGSYRDLVVHSAPLASAGKSLYAVCTSVVIDTEKTVPSIKLPIPPNPQAISKSRTSGEYWEDPEQSYGRFLIALEDSASTFDGLQYAHSALGQLAELAMSLAAISPVKPEMPTLNEMDILDIKIINPVGKWEWS